MTCDACLQGRHVRCRRPCSCMTCGSAALVRAARPAKRTKPKRPPRPKQPPKPRVKKEESRRVPNISGAARLLDDNQDNPLAWDLLRRLGLDRMKEPA